MSEKSCSSFYATVVRLNRPLDFHFARVAHEFLCHCGSIESAPPRGLLHLQRSFYATVVRLNLLRICCFLAFSVGFYATVVRLNRLTVIARTRSTPSFYATVVRLNRVVPVWHGRKHLPVSMPLWFD